jgi:hypothetical protein
MEYGRTWAWTSTVQLRRDVCGLPVKSSRPVRPTLMLGTTKSVLGSKPKPRRSGKMSLAASSLIMRTHGRAPSPLRFAPVLDKVLSASGTTRNATHSGLPSEIFESTATFAELAQRAVQVCSKFSELVRVTNADPIRHNSKSLSRVGWQVYSWFVRLQLSSSR